MEFYDLFDWYISALFDDIESDSIHLLDFGLLYADYKSNSLS